jgi:hypothetical protein
LSRNVNRALVKKPLLNFSQETFTKTFFSSEPPFYSWNSWFGQDQKRVETNLNKMAGILTVSLLVIVFAVSISYYILSQPNENQNTPSPTPTPTPTPTPSLTPTPSPSETPTKPESIPKPSVPEFTIKLADHSYDVPPYDVPPTYGIDQYTGKNVTISEGYHVEGYHVDNKTIDITITNQPFVSPDEYTHFGYNVRVKGPFGENWTELYPYTISQDVGPWNLRFQSASEDTVISIPQDYPSGGLVEIQVEAVIAIGHPLFYGAPFGYWEYLTSGWSSTQTIKIP